jgi:intracellular septation protein
MQLLLDFFPLLTFFVVYKLYGVYPATAAIIVAMALQIGLQYLLGKKVSKVLLTSGGLVAVFGGATLYLQDPVFLQWKPTILFWALAIVLVAGRLIGNKTLIERAFGEMIQLDSDLWRQFNLFWIANFLFLGAANLYVMYNFDFDTWVTFKVWWLFGWSILIAVVQAVWMAYRAPEEPEHEET